MKISDIVHSVVQVGNFGVNCSLLCDGNSAWIVDPGAEIDHILAALARLSSRFRPATIQPEAILLTHAHFDHIGAIDALQAKFPNLKVFLSPQDEPMFGHPLNQFPPDYPLQHKPANVYDCRQLTDITVIETPGHTPGSVCYYLPNQHLLLSGDTLFAGSVGRTDLPGGDMATLMKSLRKLTSLPDNVVVIPGHGCNTTIGAEKVHNPFLQH